MTYRQENPHGFGVAVSHRAGNWDVVEVGVRVFTLNKSQPTFSSEIKQYKTTLNSEQRQSHRVWKCFQCHWLPFMQPSLNYGWDLLKHSFFSDIPRGFDVGGPFRANYASTISKHFLKKLKARMTYLRTKAPSSDTERVIFISVLWRGMALIECGRKRKCSENFKENISWWNLVVMDRTRHYQCEGWFHQEFTVQNCRNCGKYSNKCQIPITHENGY